MRVVNDINCTIDFRRLKKLNVAQQIKVDYYSKINFFRRRLKSLLQIF